MGGGKKGRGIRTAVVCGEPVADAEGLMLRRDTVVVAGLVDHGGGWVEVRGVY